MQVSQSKLLPVAIILLSSLRAFGQPATTQPDRADPPDNRPMAVLARLEDAMKQIGLSDEQKSQVKSVVAETRQKFQDLREKSNGDMTQIRDGARQLLAETRQQLMNVLSPEQQRQLRDLMQGAGREGRDEPRRGDRRANAPRAEQPPRMDPEMHGDERTNDKPQSDPQPAGNAQPLTGPAAGDVAPDFTLQKLDGRQVQLSTFKDRILVLVFGSYSSPSFRQRAESIQQLSRDVGSRAAVLIIYTKEAHPKDGWQVERNRDDKVLIAAHTDQQSRTAQAKQARDALKLSVPVAVDDMSDTVARAYGAGENSAFVIGRDGKILARQNWADPFSLRRIVDEASAKKSVD